MHLYFKKQNNFSALIIGGLSLLPPCRHCVAVASGRYQSLPTKVATNRFRRSFSKSSTFDRRDQRKTSQKIRQNRRKPSAIEISLVAPFVRSAIMVKQRRQLIAVPEDNSNSNGDEDWVIVKKQKVTILVPPLPVANKSTTPNPGPDLMQEIPRKTVNNQPQYSTEPHLKKPLVDDQEKSTSLAPKRCIQIARKTPHQCIPTSGKPAMLDYRTSENPDQVGTSKLHKILGVPNNMKTVKPPRLLHGIGIGINALTDKSTLLHQRLRAINLERKLQKAGGLRRWLASLGLGQFVKLFQGKNVNKFQLVNLTMKKLKDMGADAVGPRRKLMHAIECVCQPYCFVSS